MKSVIGLIIIAVLSCSLFAQESAYSEYGNLYRFELANAPFPDTARNEGHTYKDEFFPKETHYNDSTTLAFIPDYYNPEDSVDIIVYFHGWGNNVDTVLSRFHLIEQLHASGRDAILIMPEGPKNAKDSYGGKLEQAGRFKLMVEEVLSKLSAAIDKNLSVRNIVIAGHSGAYRVLSYILLHGGLTGNIKEVYLFDALYAEVEKFSYWLNHYNGRFIDIFTPNGGTKYLSENLMVDLDAWGLCYTFIDSDEFTNEELTNSRIVFISSRLKHSEVVSSQDQFKRFLETGK